MTSSAPPRARVLVLACAAAVLLAPPAHSITIHVPGGAPTIAQALEAAVEGDSVVVACGTYFEHDLTLKSGVVLRSATGLPDCVTINAQDDGRVMFADNVSAARVEGIRLKDGLSNPGVIFGGNIPGTLSEEFPEDEEGAAFLTEGDFAPWLDSYLIKKERPELKGLQRAPALEGEHAKDGIQLSLSAVPWDPFLNTAAPFSGTRKVYLWLVCSQPGIAAFEANVAGSLAPLSFVAEGGVVNLGNAEHLLLAIPGCPRGFAMAARLGYWLVPDAAGSLCLSPTSESELLAAVDCTNDPTLYVDPAVTGFVSGTEDPCQVGTRWCTPSDEIRDVGGGAGLYAIDSSPTFDHCVFISNAARSHGGAIRSRRSSITLLDCDFENNSSPGHGGGCAFELSGTATLERCSFTGNYARTGAGIYFSHLSSSSVASSVFLRNISSQVSHQGTGGAIAAAFTELSIDQCTMASNAGGNRGGGIYSTGSSQISVSHTIIAYSTLGSAIACDGSGTASLTCCDLFGNAGGDYVSCVEDAAGVDGNLQINPLFCDLPGDNVQLNDTSACLPANNSCNALIGAEDEGCTGLAVSVTITTVPPALAIVVDGLSYVSPKVFQWYLGSSHSIGTFTPQQETAGKRYEFASWSDGGALVHNVQISETSPPVYTAQFTTMHFVTMNANPGGSVTPPSGWFAKGSLVPIQATPDPEWFFAGWTGTGSGSYTGPNPSATITVNAAISETAHFTSSTYVLTMVSGANGSVTPPSGPQPTGTVVAIEALPNPGYVFTGWTGSGPGSYTGSANPSSVTMNGNITQTAAFALPTYYLSMNATPGGSVTPASQYYSSGTIVPITATPNPGYVFLHWTGAGNGSYSGPLNPTTVTMNEALSETAVFGFAQSQCQVTMVSGPNGTTNPAPGFHVYDSGTNLQIEAIPQPGFMFSSWTGTGLNSYTGTANPANLFLLGDVTQTASFVQAYPLNMVAGAGGTVTPTSGLFPAGSQVTIQAFPNPGSTFQQWTGQGTGSYTGTSNPVVITMQGPITETASFLINPFPLTMTSTSGGTITPGSGTYPYGTQVQINAIPNSGFAFVGWTGSGAGSYSGPNPQATITILGNTSEHAVFSSAVAVTVTTNPAGHSVKVDGTYYVSPHTFQWAPTSIHSLAADSLFVIDATSRWRYSSWSDGLPRIHNFQTPSAPTMVTASYILEYLLSVAPSAEGTTIPSTGWHPSGAAISLLAIPNSNFVFHHWEGSGQGSYSGENNPALLTMNGPLQQAAFYEPFGYNFSMSASDVDPFVNTAPPAGGIRSIYLWLTCAEEGIAAFQGTTAGSLTPLAFAPAPGIFNAGTATDLLLAIPGCPSGDSIQHLLGFWLVDDQGGDLCFAPSSEEHLFAGVNCDSIVPTLLHDPRIVGFSSSGPACVLDVNPCVGSPLVPERSPSAPVALALPRTTSLSGIDPNPFSGKTDIRFTLAGTEKTRMAIYDVAGRLVERLVDQEMPAGDHRIAWTGRNTQGGSAPAGVYFALFEAGEVRQIRKLIFLGVR